MRRSLLLLLALVLSVASCGNETSTLTAGDVTDASAEDGTGSPATTTAVASDSAPIELGPTTTAHWEDTLVEYPLLTVLDDQQNVSIGRALFVHVDDEGNPLFSGSHDIPNFIVTVTAWYGVDAYIEHTISTWFGEVIAGEVRSSTECGGDAAHLTKIGADSYLRIKNQLPQIRGSELVWTSDGCAENLPAGFDSIFDGEITIEVTNDGFIVTSASGDGARFVKLDPPPAIEPVPTTVAVATTEPPQTTAFPQTTTTGPSSD